MSQKNLWPKKLQELNDVAPMWPDEVVPGDVLVVNENKDGFEFSHTAAQGEKGDKGDQGEPGIDGEDGPPNVLSVGSVVIGAPNEADVTIEGTSPEQVLNFVIPKGDQGEPGTPATNPNFTVGGVSTGAPAVELTGVYPNLALNFQLPPGVKGDTGDTGPANSLTIGTVDVGSSYDATITGEAPNQVLNLVMAPGPQGIPGVIQEIYSANSGLTVDNTDPANPILTVNFPAPPAPVAVIPQVLAVTVSRNIAPTDENKYLRSTSATAVTLTVPVDLALVDLAAEIHVRQAGAGLVTIAADSGVTINVPFGGTLALAGQGATVTLKKVAENEYDLFGLVEAAP